MNINERSFGTLRSVNPTMHEVFALLERVVDSDVPVLVQGETGTGKERVAQSIHAASDRHEGPLVVVDCGAISASLIENELFGHEKGSFTGAHGTTKGLFEQADGGTLFLDELGELPLELQPKLLRVLEHQTIRRVGGHDEISVDVRLVAATNRDLRAEVRRRSFREDLYYRIAGVEVLMPPLRERLDDVPLLVHEFIASDHPEAEANVPQATLTFLQAYKWPGNLRELRHAVYRLVLTNDCSLDENTLTQDQTSLSMSRSLLPLPEARRRAMELFERAYTNTAMSRGQNNVARAASIAGVSRQLFQRLIKKHG